MVQTKVMGVSDGTGTTGALSTLVTLAVCTLTEFEGLTTARLAEAMALGSELMIRELLSVGEALLSVEDAPPTVLCSEIELSLDTVGEPLLNTLEAGCSGVVEAVTGGALSVVPELAGKLVVRFGLINCDVLDGATVNDVDAVREGVSPCRLVSTLA